MEFEYFANGDPTKDQPSTPPVYQIRFNSTSMADWGKHDITLRFELIDYPTSTANSERWLVEGHIEYCLVQSLRVPNDMIVEFVVGQKPVNVQYNY